MTYLNCKLLAVLVLCLPLADAAHAVDKKKKKPASSSDKPSTLPPKSPMIVIPPPDATTLADQGTKLISSEMNGTDLQFFTRAVDAGRLQAFVVDLLKTKASSEQIKGVGEALSSTQDSENKQIARLAALKGWTVSTEPTAAQKKIGADLDKLSGSNFDKAAMDQVISASQEAVNAYQAATGSTDHDIRDFSQQMLPLAQDRLKLVEKLTGAGNKAASQLFRTKPEPKPAEPAPAAPTTPKPAATPAATPDSAPPKSIQSGQAPAATPVPATPAAKKSTPTPKPTATPKATPKPTATPKAPASASKSSPPPTPSATPAATPAPAPTAANNDLPVNPANAAGVPTASPTPKPKLIFPVAVDPATIPNTSARPVPATPSEPRPIPPPITK